MLNDIERRWGEWVASPSGRRQLACWAERHQPLGSWTIERLGTPISSPETDAAQAILVALAQERDQGAVITLIMQLRPGLRRLVWWLSRFGNGRGAVDCTDDVVAQFCEVLLSHSLDRRPRRIAANLLLDTKQKLWRANMKASAIPPSDIGVDLVSIAAPEESIGELDMFDELANAIDRLRGSAASRRLTAEVAYRAWILDEANADIAADVGLRPETVRTRLSRLRSLVER